MSEKISRTCATCACSMVQTNPNDPKHQQLFCRLDPPTYHLVEVEVPRIKDGQPVSNPRGPGFLTDKVQQSMYAYKPTDAKLVCFKGWRPIGTEPGRHDIRKDAQALMDIMEPILNAIGIVRGPTEPLDS